MPGIFPLNNWSVLNAYPVKWDISALNSQKNELVIETLEMAYTKFDPYVDKRYRRYEKKNNLSNGYNYKKKSKCPQKVTQQKKGTRPPSLP